MRRARATPWTALIGLLALVTAAALLWYALDAQAPPPTAQTDSALVVTMLDVGQGDSILIRSPAGRTMLVDAGNQRRDAEQVILPYMKRHGVSSLDYLVLTHPHQDHVGGMPALLDAVAVGTFVDSVQPGQTNNSYMQTLQRVQAKGIKPVKARKGGSDIDLGTGTQVQILGPEDPLITRSNSDNNNNSVVLCVTYGSVSVLLTGDVEKEAERRLLSQRDALRSQVLKVAHHGSRSSTSSDFLDAVRPEIALISAGAGNSYGHPHQETLDGLETRKIQLYRTDRNGNIEVFVDERGPTVATER